MVAIPSNQATQEDMALWYNIQVQLKTLKAQESALRRKIFGTYFPEPREGANTFVLPDGYQLKATHVINRTIDEAAMAVNAQRYAELEISVDRLVKKKPELVTSAYRLLSDEQRKAFDESLTIKDGSPTLEIVKPSTRGQAKG